MIWIFIGILLGGVIAFLAFMKFIIWPEIENMTQNFLGDEDEEDSNDSN
jgi:hypothetical protein